MAERSEAESAKRSFASKYQDFFWREAKPKARSEALRQNIKIFLFDAKLRFALFVLILSFFFTYQVILFHF